jgi:hypothetical protein
MVEPASVEMGGILNSFMLFVKFRLFLPGKPTKIVSNGITKFKDSFINNNSNHLSLRISDCLLFFSLVSIFTVDAECVDGRYCRDYRGIYFQRDHQ